jgi:cytochrome P450
MFQPLLTAVRRNPYPLYSVLRRARPLAHLSRYDLWIASRYDDVKRVLSDHEHFSSRFRERMGGAAPERTSLITSDPPEHTRLRGLVSKGFTPRAIAALEPRIEDIANELLDNVADHGRIDLVGDLAYPLPVIVIAEMLGVPAEDRMRFKEWSDEIVRAADRAVLEPESLEGMVEADLPMPPEVMNTMVPYLLDIVAQRRAEPREDLISALVSAELDGERLTDRDILAFTSLLLVAGNVTTTNLITNAIETLLRHPEQWALLQRDPELVPQALEEVLRFRSPVQFMFRVVGRDTEMGGHTLRENDRVIALIGSANRDSSRFDQPHRFDITRSPNPHLSFGHGVHYCLGAPLARLEAKVALRIILERLPNLERVGRERQPLSDSLILHGVKRLPLRFSPAPVHVA